MDQLHLVLSFDQLGQTSFHFVEFAEAGRPLLDSSFDVGQSL